MAPSLFVKWPRLTAATLAVVALWVLLFAHTQAGRLDTFDFRVTCVTNQNHFHITTARTRHFHMHFGY